MIDVILMIYVIQMMFREQKEQRWLNKYIIGYSIRTMVLRQQIFADGDHGDPLAVHLVSDTLSRLRATEFQVPVHISGLAGPDLGRLGQQASHCSGRAAFRPHAHSPALR